jgi:hypothetical protein
MDELIDTKNISDEFNELIKEFHLTTDKLRKILIQDTKRKANLKKNSTPEKMQIYREKNRDKIILYGRHFYKKNKEVINKRIKDKKDKDKAERMMNGEEIKKIGRPIQQTEKYITS